MPLPTITDRRVSPNHTARTPGVAVEALILHWSGGRFNGSLDWIGRSKDPRTGDPIYASYHCLLGNNGQVAYPVPWNRAAMSVGKSSAKRLEAELGRSFGFGRSGNSATENIAFEGGPPTRPSALAIENAVLVCVHRMRAHGWGADQVDFRIGTHCQICEPAGRKDDVLGRNWNKEKGLGLWFDLPAFRKEVARRLVAASPLITKP